MPTAPALHRQFAARRLVGAGVPNRGEISAGNCEIGCADKTLERPCHVGERSHPVLHGRLPAERLLDAAHVVLVHPAVDIGHELLGGIKHPCVVADALQSVGIVTTTHLKESVFSQLSHGSVYTAA